MTHKQFHIRREEREGYTPPHWAVVAPNGKIHSRYYWEESAQKKAEEMNAAAANGSPIPNEWTKATQS